MPAESLIPILILGSLALLGLALPGKRGFYTRCVCAILATLFIVNHFWKVLNSQTRAAKIQAVVQTEKAEIPLRIMTTVNIGVARVYSNFGPIEDKSGHRRTVMEMSNTGAHTFFQGARKSLVESLKANPDSLNTRVKLIICLGTMGHRAQIKELDHVCDEMAASDKPENKEIAAFLKSLYINRHIVARDVPRDLKLIDAHVSRGWFYDQIKLALFQASGSEKLYKAYAEEVEGRYWQTFLRGLLALAVILIASFVGIIAIVIQLGSLSRKKILESKSQTFGVNVSLSTVYSIFLAWFVTQSAIGFFLKMLPSSALGGNPMYVALSTMGVYFINMIPALLYIYFLAVKPHKISLAESLKIPESPSQAGRQILTGLLAWCAMFPLVITSAALAAGYLGSKGSENSIIAEIISAANSANIPAIALLYGTLAVLAPLCEELIFRAFLYSSLRSRLGVFFSILLSSLIFAGIHFDKGGFLMLFSIGFVLAFCYERYRNILACVIGHGLWNCGSFTLALLFFSN